jgi:hypothetical protein
MVGHCARPWAVGQDCPLMLSTVLWYHPRMKRKHQRTLELVFARPTSGNVQWRDIEAMFVELGAEVSEREGSRVAVFLFDEVRVFHRPHPSPNTDKGAVASVRKWLEQHGVEP